MAGYDLEKRTFQFAKNVSLFVKTISRTIANIEYSKQLIISSASIGANYIEANESLGKKDFLMHVRISRKEAKGSIYWLRLILEINENKIAMECKRLIIEADELKKILSAIIEKLK